MSVLIKGMDMPKDCWDCRLVDIEYSFCHAKGVGGKWDEFMTGKERPEWCPLVEVPTPHGRLIDASEMLSAESEAFMSAQLKVKDEATRLVNEVVHKKIQMLLADAPTVIEAEADNE